MSSLHLFIPCSLHCSSLFSHSFLQSSHCIFSFRVPSICCTERVGLSLRYPLTPSLICFSFQMDRIKGSIRDLQNKRGIVTVRSLFHTLAHGDDSEYEQFENREGELSTFQENHTAFRLFGTGVHVKVGAYLAAGIGLVITLLFCVFYSLYHTRGQGYRNAFLDSIELIDLIYAFLVGIPCHIILAIGIHQERKTFFGPFLVFYASNFILNIIFTFLIICSAAFDFHRQFFGNVQWDFSWALFQIGWISAQFLAIFVVIKCRRYVGAKAHFKASLSSSPYSVTTESSNNY